MGTPWTPHEQTSAMMKKGWKDQNVLEKGWKDSTSLKKMRRNWGKIVVPEWVRSIYTSWHWASPWMVDIPTHTNLDGQKIDEYYSIGIGGAHFQMNSEGYPCNIRWSYLWSANIASSIPHTGRPLNEGLGLKTWETGNLARESHRWHWFLWK